HKRSDDIARMDGGKTGSGGIGDQIDSDLKVAFDPVPHRKRKKKDDRHDAEKNGNPPDLACQDLIHFFRKNILALLVQKNFIYDLADKIIFLVDDIRFVTAVYNLRQ